MTQKHLMSMQILNANKLFKNEQIGISNKQYKRLLLQIFTQRKHRQPNTTSVTKIVSFQFQLENKCLKI